MPVREARENAPEAVQANKLGGQGQYQPSWIHVQVCTDEFHLRRGVHRYTHSTARVWESLLFSFHSVSPQVFSSQRHGSVAWPSRSRCRRRALTAAVGGTPPAARAQRPR